MSCSRVIIFMSFDRQEYKMIQGRFGRKKWIGCPNAPLWRRGREQSGVYESNLYKILTNVYFF